MDNLIYIKEGFHLSDAIRSAFTDSQLEDIVDKCHEEHLDMLYEFLEENPAYLDSVMLGGGVSAVDTLHHFIINDEIKAIRFYSGMMKIKGKESWWETFILLDTEFEDWLKTQPSGIEQ